MVGNEIGEYIKHTRLHGTGDRRDRLIGVGRSAALGRDDRGGLVGLLGREVGTESSLKLAKASATRTKANRAFQESLTFRTADGILFNTWFAAY